MIWLDLPKGLNHCFSAIIVEHHCNQTPSQTYDEHFVYKNIGNAFNYIFWICSLQKAKRLRLQFDRLNNGLRQIKSTVS
jgi:hypothetical protein